MTALKFKSYVVADNEGDVVFMGSGLECNRMVRKMNAGGYRNAPYGVFLAEGRLEGSK